MKLFSHPIKTWRSMRKVCWLFLLLLALAGAGRSEELIYQAPGTVAALDFSTPDKFYLHFATADVVLDGNRRTTFGQRRIQKWNGNRLLSTLRTPVLMSDLPNGTTRFARDDSHFIYNGGGGLVRRAFYSTQAQAQILTTFTGEDTADGGGAMLAAGGRVFWGEYSQLGYQIFSHTTALGGTNASHGRINAFDVVRSRHRLKKMVLFDAGSALALTEGGDLFSFSLTPGGTLTPIASNLVDFAWRREVTGTGNFIKQLRIYGITGTNTAGNPPGEVRRYNPATLGGNGTLLFTAPVVNGLGYRFAEIEVDDQRVFLRRVPMVNGVFGPEPDFSSITTWRAVADSDVAPAAAPWNFTSIPVNGDLLRSDGKWLYFARGQQILREPASIEPVELDFGMVGVEITQMLQSADNAVKLVCGKRTFVRAYASEMVNRGTGITGFSVGAKLRVFRRRPFDLAGTLLPEEELAAPPPLLNMPTLLPLSTERGTLRAKTETGYLWELPTDWVAAAAEVRVAVEINADRAVPELAIASNPEFDSYANNRISSATATLTRFPTDPVLVMVPIVTRGASFFGSSIGDFDFAPHLRRAKALLPVRRFHLYTVRRSFLSPTGSSYTLEDGGISAIDDLRLSSEFQVIPDGCDMAYIVGAVHPNWGGDFNGIGNGPGHTTLVAMRDQRFDGNGRPVFKNYNLPQGGRTLAHELGHNFGIHHVNFPAGGPAGPYANYPFPANAFGFTNALNSDSARFGFDPLTLTALSPTDAADLMSYGLDRWTSENTYQTSATRLLADEGMPASDLFSFLPLGANGRQLAALERSPRSVGAGVTRSPRSTGATHYFVVQGSYDEAAGEGSLRPVWKVPATTLPETAITRSEEAAAAITTPEVVLRQLNASGAVLRTTPAVLSHVEDSGHHTESFTQILAAEPGAVRVEVRAATGLALAAHAASPNAPMVTVGAPELSLENNRLRWSWNATDADGGPLFFLVHYVTPAGRQEVLTNFTRDLSIELDPRHLPGAEGARLRVLACDGFHTTVAESAPFTIPNHAPEVRIGNLREGERLAFGAPHHVTATALDAEQGTLPPNALSWTINGAEYRTGTGEEIPLAGLRPGFYGLQVDALDRDGLSASLLRSFTILPAVVPEAAVAPVLDGFVDAGYAGALTLPIELPGGSRATAQLVHHGGKLFGVLSGFPAQDAATPASAPPGIAGIRVDLDGTGSAGIEDDLRTLEIDEAGAKLYWHTFFGSWMREAAPPVGFDAVTSFGDAGWNVEFSLTEELLGGWNHLIGLSAHYTPNGGGSFSAWPAGATSASPAGWAQVWLGTAVPPQPNAPYALAGGDRTETPRASTRIGLDATASYDPDGDALTYSWTQTGGPPVALNDPASALPSFAHGPVTTPVSYTFRLVVNDGALDSNPATTTVTVAPAPAQVAWPAPDTRPDEIERLSGGGYAIRLSAAPLLSTAPTDSFATDIGRLYTVETSPDLVTWTPLRREPADWTARIEFTDTPPAGEPRRFYRLRR